MVVCTKCSSPVKPIVATDIDGTLGDYHGHLYRFAADYFGDQTLWSELDAYDGSVGHREWFEKNGIKPNEFREMKLAYRQGGMKRSMVAAEGARELCQGIREAGAELWLTTSRPYLRLDNIDPDTREFLRRREIRYDYMIYGKSKYSMLAERVDPERVVAVLEDDPLQYDSAAVEFGDHVPILKRIHYNRSVRRRMVVQDLAAARLMILAHIEDWKIKHSFDALPSTT